MSLGGRTFRAFRPSRFARQDELEEDDSHVKQAKIQLYSERAEAGQPLFEPSNVVKALANSQKLSAG